MQDLDLSTPRERAARRRTLKRKFLLASALGLAASLAPAIASAHTTRICWRDSGGVTTFYAGSYHSPSEGPSPVGKIILDGFGYPFSGYILPSALPSDVQCFTCTASTPGSFGTPPAVVHYQTFTSAFELESHSISFDTSTVVQSPWCTFPSQTFGSSTCADADFDGLCNDDDVCPLDAANDGDGDGICADSDNCPLDYNPSQVDANSNGQGDVCEGVVCGNALLQGAEECDDGNMAGGDGCSAICTLEAPDTDGDGIPDPQDVCPGSDDASDADGDGTADGCDACPADYYNDSDGDGSCDSADECPLDADDDLDGDELCADVDSCPNDPDNDADSDGVCADLDRCPLDAANDADGDGVCGNVDACAGGDDNVDADGDGAANACDVCPNDAANDADSDGVCGDVDPCPVDALNDADGDGSCADQDLCPFDADDDLDVDGICGDVDPCPSDAANDADGDGLCESTDNCPTVANTNQSDVDADGIGDSCEPDNDGDGVIDDDDNCPLDANADQQDSDGDGAGNLCDTDDDGDGVIDSGDVCLETPPATPVLSNGCSIDQQCVCTSPWKNHGAYTSCVAHASESLLASGLITKAQKDAIVSAAGSSSCGKR